MLTARRHRDARGERAANDGFDYEDDDDINDEEGGSKKARITISRLKRMIFNFFLPTFQVCSSLSHASTPTARLISVLCLLTCHLRRYVDKGSSETLPARYSLSSFQKHSF